MQLGGPGGREIPRAINATGRRHCRVLAPRGRPTIQGMVGRTFRTRLLLRVAIWSAGVLWALVLGALVLHPGAGPEPILSAAAFVAFFAAFGFVHGRTWIAVTAEGIVASSPRRVVRVAFAEIERIVVHEGAAGRLYALSTRHGPVRFTSLLARHRELFALLVERAELAPP